MDSAYISAFSALAGAAIGGSTSFITAWLTQRTQLRHAHREAERAALETLYRGFITEASLRLGDAFSHQKDDVTEIVNLYAMIGHMRLVSNRAVVDAAEKIIAGIIEAYMGPNLTLHEALAVAERGKLNFLVEFGEACRRDLADRYSHPSRG